MPIVKIKGINISYKVEGQGEPLVMIHGLGNTKCDWMLQTPSFSRHYRVITFDNRGAGRSDKPGGPYTTKIMADDVIGLMNFLKLEKAHILGFSLGGMIAQELAIQYPERINKLILASTFCCQDNLLNGHTPELFGALDLRLKGKAGPVTRLAFNNSVNRIVFTILNTIHAKLENKTDTIGLIAQKEADVNHFTADRLYLISSPTLVITGTADRITKPSSSAQIAQLIPDAKITEIDGGSHSLIAENKEAFNRKVLDFLETDFLRLFY